MIEAALVFDREGETIHWHEPAGRTAGSLPDSRDLWEVLWEHRDRLGGVAHTHPWDGPASPSGTDLTTFAAVERGLGRRLVWPVVTYTDVAHLVFDAARGDYVRGEAVEIRDLEALREKSRGGVR